MGEETGTITEESLKKETKMEKNFRSIGFNPNLVMLKITLFVFYGGNGVN